MTEAATLTEEISDMLYTAFRRALGAWIVKFADGRVQFEIGEFADSPSACLWPSYQDATVTKIGWIVGSDMGGSGPCGEEVVVSSTAFAEFLQTDGFVAYGSPESVKIAEAAAAEQDRRMAEIMGGSVRIVKVR